MGTPPKREGLAILGTKGVCQIPWALACLCATYLLPQIPGWSKWGLLHQEGVLKVGVGPQGRSLPETDRARARSWSSAAGVFAKGRCLSSHHPK
jgi:hypothetical protein